MKTRMFEFAIGILATGMIAAGLLLYAFREPERIAAAQVEQILTDLDEAMSLYAENCSICHGLAGEGIAAAPPLDSAGLRASDAQALEKIISRGLYGTAMPAWHTEDGGPLSDYQVGEMVTLIRFGDWNAVQDRVVNLGLAPRVPFNTEPDPELLAAVAELPGGESLAQGVTLYAQYCVACHGADGLGTSLAPALNDPSVRAMSAEELLRIIESGVSGTLMPAWSGALTPQQIEPLVDLIAGWERIPAGAIPEPDRPVAVTEQSLALGQELYAANCAHCHAAEGQGTPRAPALNVKGFLESTLDAAIQQIVKMGVPGTAMPAWGDRLADHEIQALVGFIRAWEPDAPEVAEQARGGGPWWATGENAAASGGGSGPAWMRDGGNAPQGGGQSGGRGAGGANGQSGGGGRGSGNGAANGNTAGGPPAWAGGGGAQGAAEMGIGAGDAITGTLTDGETPAGAEAGAVQDAVESGVGVSETITSTHAGGGPPAWAGGPDGAPAAEAVGVGASEGITGAHTGGGPPEWAGSGAGSPDASGAGGHFASAAVESASAPADPRQVILFGALGGLSLGPVALALIGLLRLRRRDQSSPL